MRNRMRFWNAAAVLILLAGMYVLARGQIYGGTTYASPGNAVVSRMVSGGQVGFVLQPPLPDRFYVSWDASLFNVRWNRAEVMVEVPLWLCDQLPSPDPLYPDLVLLTLPVMVPDGGGWVSLSGTGPFAVAIIAEADYGDALWISSGGGWHIGPWVNGSPWLGWRMWTEVR